MWFTRVSIGNPVMATMVMLAFVVLGLFSYQRLAVDQFPNIDFPTVVVQMDYPGASPEIVESEVTKKIEEAVNTVAGINSLYSRSYEGTAVVIVEFNLDVDGRKAADDVREKVALIRPNLRDEVKEPRISRFDPASQPIFNVAVLSTDGQRTPQELTTWAAQVLQKRLENVRGVGAVSVIGGVEREINVYVRPAALDALGLSVDQVVAAVKSENQELPMGSIRTREQERVVQVNARLKRPEDFREIIVARRGPNGGAAVKLWQVADVVDGPQEIESLALYNGQRTVLLSVQKSQGENTIEVVDGLNKALADSAALTPPGIRVEVNRDSSRGIRVSVANVKRTLFEGAALTVLIVFLFLNSWRSTIITGLTLPIALIGTFLFMYVFGFTINTITMMALSLCVGLLIDDAIVVRENIVRHVQMGKSAHQAALDGTNEIGLAVLATTLSIVAVFLPIGFMGGIVGKFFHEFGLTIVAAVLISMFVSFTLDPMLSSVWNDPAAHGVHRGPPVTLYDKTVGRVTGAFDRFTLWLSHAYQEILGWALGHKLATLGIALATFVGSFFLIPVLGAEFVPKADFSETQVNFYTPVGSSIEVTEMRAKQIDAALREMPEVRYTVTTINSGNALGKIYGSTYVRLVDRQDRSRNLNELSVPLRERLSRIPGITVTNIGPTDLGGGKSLQFSIQGADLAELARLSAQLDLKLRAIPGLVDLDTTLKPDKPTVAIDVKRDAASDVGLNVNALANSLRTLVAGTTVGNWRAPDGENYDVNVRLTPDSRHTLEDLQRLPINVGAAADGAARSVRLSQVADVTPSTGPNQINRRDLNREINIDGNAYGRSSGDVSADIRRALDGISWPPGYRYVFGGATKNMNESFAYAVGALALAVVFIYMILASQFRSFLQPLALMSSLPLTLIGVVLALLMFRSTLNMFSIIGIVMLMGLVTKNAILLVDFAIRSRAGEHRGDHGLDHDEPPMTREQALLHAAEVRLRPILMTTLAMIFGMVPLAFALSEGSEQRAPMGQAVIGGVITSSLLTLVVVPVIYCYLDDLATWAARRWAPPKMQGLPPPHPASGGTPP
ncbi:MULTISPECIES: efflux RND transporter permease subunit [unclassified Rhizobacter]|uniref:efflux RND transporter permease subunit n=1 Tax=unclassified Rhizobacter TaxID=2640088 RepID=UPI0006FA5988|nr:MULTISPECIES: efflux RND transporter permease subunit [unclassified Rhizobacter]KQU81327.1 nodulation protein NolG [Rhizobacter sp. Root29]KQW09321.1 nodulation protein NolG [Rhizobacter sp. Root1238]KRB18149.1 nodulation protein NolG [Rhizobacter sp. Root16D2]